MSGRRSIEFLRQRVAPLIAVLTLSALLQGCEAEHAEEPPAAKPVDLGQVSVGEEVATFYREREFKPLWIAGRRPRPEAELLVRKIEEAALHGLDPARYEPKRLRKALAAAQSPEPKVAAQAELLISQAYANFAKDLRAAPEQGSTLFVDPELKGAPASGAKLLERLGSSGDFGREVAAGLSVNPLYDRLAAGFARYFRTWAALPQDAVPATAELRPGMSGEPVRLLRRRLGVGLESATYDVALANAVRRFEAVHGLPADGIADRATLAALNRGYRHYERIIQMNLDRARALNAAPERFVLVDSAGARLWLFEGGRPVDTMRVIVGKSGMETPDMAALIRYAALNPYWNVPPDLIRTSVARQVLKRGVGHVRAQRLQVLSDWSPRARVLDPARVNWRAVAAGRELVQVRQLPGPGNVMGRMKFMFPNKLGIYLHDTPEKSLFARADRRISSGCVRLEDAERVGRWLFGGVVPEGSGAAEQKVNLPEPVPVYIIHMTAMPGPGGIRFQPDLYGRDAKPLSSAPGRARRDSSA